MPPPVVISLQQYLNLITSEHNQQPKYMATVSLSVQPGVDNANSALSLIGLFDLDTAVGQQLDFTGQWIGQSRYLILPTDPWFSWDTTGLGWDQGIWFEPYATPGQQVALDDYHYRILLYAKVAANFWDGTIPGAYTAWNTLFAGTGYQILIQDQMARDGAAAGVHGNMHIVQAILGPPLDAITQALFLGGHLGLKSAGVGITYMTQAQPPAVGVGKPLFAWDAGPTTGPATYPPTPLAGWDLGAWGVTGTISDVGGTVGASAGYAAATGAGYAASVAGSFGIATAAGMATATPAGATSFTLDRSQLGGTFALT